MAQKINNLEGIKATFEAKPDLKKVHILADGRHFFNEQHAKEANGYTEKSKDNKAERTLNKVEYKTFAPDAAELNPTAPAV